MKISKLITLIASFFLVSTRFYAQDFQQYVHLLTKAEAASTGVQLGCTCYRNVQWQQASATITGLPVSERRKAQPVAKPTQTEVYHLYELVAGVAGNTSLILREKHTIVVIDLRISIKESNYIDVMARKKLTFVAELLNFGGSDVPIGTIKSWSLDARIPTLLSYKQKTYEIIGQASRVEKEVMTENDNSNSDLIDKWTFNYSVNLNGRNCSGESPRKIISAPVIINVYKFLITKFTDKASQKPWKIVVGQEIEKEANTSPDCTNFVWEMPDTKSGSQVWHLPQSGRTMLPFSDLSSNGTVPIRKNDDFGDKYGTVRVSCKDNLGNGNIHVLYSRSAPSELSMNPQKAVKVYFPRDVDLQGIETVRPDGYPRNTNEPLWFIFWKEGNVINNLLNNVKYISKEDRAGETVSGQVYVTALGVNYYDYPTERHTAFEIGTGLEFIYGGQGFHAQHLIGTIIHENYHKKVDDEWGGVLDIGSTRAGHSDTDGIPDTEERNSNGGVFPISYFNFADSYDLATEFDWDDFKYFGDNELRCQIIDYNVTSTDDWKPYYFDKKDWSAHKKNPNW